MDFSRNNRFLTGKSKGDITPVPVSADVSQIEPDTDSTPRPAEVSIEPVLPEKPGQKIGNIMRWVGTAVFAAMAAAGINNVISPKSEEPKSASEPQVILFEHISPPGEKKSGENMQMKLEKLKHSRINGFLDEDNTHFSIQGTYSGPLKIVVTAINGPSDSITLNTKEGGDFNLKSAFEEPVDGLKYKVFGPDGKELTVNLKGTGNLMGSTEAINSEEAVRRHPVQFVDDRPTYEL